MTVNSPINMMNLPASPWVARFAPILPAGEVLDLACGTGRHTRLLAVLGHPVLALDRKPEALAAAAGPGVTTMEYDLEDGSPWPFAAGRFAAIVVTNYLYRPLFPQLAASLRPDGVLIYETFAQGNQVYGKPSNPDFLLGPGELLALAAGGGLQVLAYEDGHVEAPHPAQVQRLCAAGPAFGKSEARLDHIVVRNEP
ncbi:bifunctional 2-polyprenyl-6-hydroxyphenol methylase/3-demethylubiquinol 3-O-methyltransferase UbiG [Massilia sp. ST3]|uniref:class I SAM-dependent methyltransferase n=1 Tax=Massilia sp. ST3 TaxID=2824903 RepID=UPI001B830EDD|nr:class I SAM-dependent methyltransferase [Massilia sp. ST3]MBQ5946632.1 class I SAM-dependent methyltransferase [Massilia sp. ST3]